MSFDQQFYAEIEKRVVARLEEIEGRVPTNDEVALHGNRLVYPDGKQEIQWKGVTILRIHSPEFNAALGPIGNWERKIDVL